MIVRILRSVSTGSRAYRPGSLVELDEVTAKSWLKAGIAELDRSLPGPPEVKESAPAADRTAGSGASNARGSKAVPEIRRKRGK